MFFRVAARSTFSVLFLFVYQERQGDDRLGGEIEDPGQVNVGVHKVIEERALGEAAYVHIVQDGETYVNIAEGEEEKSESEKPAAPLIPWSEDHAGDEVCVVDNADEGQLVRRAAEDREGCQNQHRHQDKANQNMCSAALFILVTDEEVKEDEELCSREEHHTLKLLYFVQSHQAKVCRKGEEHCDAEKVAVLEAKEQAKGAFIAFLCAAELNCKGEPGKDHR